MNLVPAHFGENGLPMRKSSIRLAAALASVALVVTGCSSSKDATASTDKQVEVITWWSSDSDKASLEAMTSEFNSVNSNTKFVDLSTVDGFGIGAKAKELISSRLDANNPPDSFQTHVGMEVTHYVKARQLEDLTSLYAAEGWDKVIPSDLLDSLMIGGKIYTVPLDIHRANVLWWNPATAKKAGITSAPSTLTEFFADLAKFKAIGIPGIAIAGKGDWAVAQLFDWILLASMGADKYEGLFSGSTSWTGPEVSTAIAAFQKALSFANKDAITLDWQGAGKLVTSGHAGYFIMGDWASAQWQSDGLKAGTDFAWAAAPGTTKIYQWLSDAFTLPIGAKDRNGALAWLKVAGSKAGQDAFNVKKGSISPRTDSDLTNYDAYQKDAAAQWRTDRHVGSTVHGVNASSAFMSAFNAAVGKYLSGGAKENVTLAKDLALAYKSGKV